MAQGLPLREENEIRAAFRVLGAVTPATALSGKDLKLDPTSFQRLLHHGVIREGAPGTFYLYEDERPRGPGIWIRQILFWLAVVILPVALIQYCPGSP
jgi:hypothetical protein